MSLTPETLAELRRLLDEFRETKPGRATAAPFAALVDALLTHADALSLRDAAIQPAPKFGQHMYQATSRWVARPGANQ